MAQKSLEQIVEEKPFADYADWWQVGETFLQFMSNAIVPEWAALAGNRGDLAGVHGYVGRYCRTVFDVECRETLAADFAYGAFARRESGRGESPIRSGAFDALSYAFYRSAFELIQEHREAYAHSLARERRLFTERVGKRFYRQVHEHLRLDLPAGLRDEGDFRQLRDSIGQVGAFLSEQGYLRDHFAFRFDVDAEHAGRRIMQPEGAFLTDLKRNGVAYALYEMGYPIILPSAVYLFHTIGEAQHHSSRTIEELFGRIGYEARETDDFDPTDYPADLVVELWEIRPAF